MQKKTTDELDAILDSMKPEQYESYVKENSHDLVDEKKAFYYYMKDVIESKNIKLKDVYSFADFSESMGSKILSMEKHTKNRDNILRLCIAGHFTLVETNKALKLYGMSPLYSRDARDVVVILKIQERKYDLAEINQTLKNSGFEPLIKEKNED